MDFHILRPGGDVHVMSTHRGQDDETPLQLISTKQLAHYVALERAVITFAEVVTALLSAQQVQQAPGSVDSKAEGIKQERPVE